jgi:dodecin
MNNHVYKKIELTGSSTTSMEDAIRTAVDRASQTIRHMRWFEVVETRGYIEDNQIAYWQVTVKIGFTLEDED